MSPCFHLRLKILFVVRPEHLDFERLDLLVDLQDLIDLFVLEGGWFREAWRRHTCTHEGGIKVESVGD